VIESMNGAPGAYEADNMPLIHDLLSIPQLLKKIFHSGLSKIVLTKYISNSN
jgi:hypothetical protein